MYCKSLMALRSKHLLPTCALLFEIYFGSISNIYSEVFLADSKLIVLFITEFYFTTLLIPQGEIAVRHRQHITDFTNIHKGTYHKNKL